MGHFRNINRAALLTAVSGIGLATAAQAQTAATEAAQQAITQAPNAAAQTVATPPLSATPQVAPTDQAASPSQTSAEQGSVTAGTATTAQDIVVTGIRGSQQRSVNLKRNAASVVDSISAEDIGKLPDRTIADSLQRIPGVQIRRDAGEGAQINIRGLPQVTTLLNGEEFLSAQSITQLAPNLNDIPSQLFFGADVIKSRTADLLDAGITGTVNLRTRRPFDLKEGLTVAAAGEGSYGDKAKQGDPSFNGLLSWHNDKVGFLVSGAYSDVHLSNSHSGIQEGYGATLHNEQFNTAANPTGDVNLTNGFSPPNRTHGTIIGTGRDVNGNGSSNDIFIVPQGFTGWNKIDERQRIGANASAQWHINDALTLTGDAFYTRQNEYDRTAGFQMQNINWQAGEFVPGVSRDTGRTITQTSGGISHTYDLNTVQVYNYDLGDFTSYSQNDHYKSQSQNYNAELKYDNDGPLKATLRGIYAKAYNNYDQSYAQFSESNGRQWQPGGIGTYPASLGGDRAFNPNGYSVNTIAGNASLPATVNFTGNKPTFTLPAQLVAELGNPADYALKTLSSEGNYRRKGDLKLVRGDASYDANDDIKFEVGGRYSERSADDYEFDRAAPLYAGQASQPGGCLVKWKAFDVTLNDASCTAGPAGGYYTAGLTRLATDPTLAGYVKKFGVPTSGVPGIYVLDPAKMDNALKFQNTFYPGEVNVENYGASFHVGVQQESAYGQMDFKGDLFGMSYAGNAGFTYIHTDLNILQNIVGSPQAYGLANLPNGTLRTKRGFDDYLPAFNLAFNISSRLKFRFAFSKTMTLLDLSQWGGGFNPNYAIEQEADGSHLFRVTGGNSTGNPQLNPWRATNVEGSLEYYIGRASLLSIDAFHISVDSFIQNGTVLRSDLPDNDGVVRGRTVAINTPIQGQGGTLQGIEAGAQLSFSDLRFMPRLLSNFGIQANGTFSPSKAGGRDLAGNSIPFQDNSKIQTNLTGFYQDRRFQARVAWNYRSKRAAQSDFGGISGLELYQSATNYVDASVSFDVTPNITIYAQGSNVLGEYEHYYLTFKDENAYNNIYERRWTGGVRVKF